MKTYEEIRAAIAVLPDSDRAKIAAEFGAKTPRGWRGLLSDPKLPFTLVLFVISSISTWQMMKQTADPVKKQEYFSTWLYASAGVWSAMMVAMGYQKGKENEGTVPEGHIAVPKLIAAPVAVVPVAGENIRTAQLNAETASVQVETAHVLAETARVNSETESHKRE